MIRISVWLSVILLTSLFSPVHAASENDALSCYAGYGTIWGENEKDIPKREIDGSAIKTPKDLARVTGTREHGLKIIKGGDFSGWDMRGLSLHGVCFEEANLSGANLAGVQAAGSGFIKSDLTGANMQDGVMPGIMFRDANLTDAKAQKANFHGGHFDGGWFEGGVAGWNLDGATMIEFTFECGITLPDGCPVYQGGDPISAQLADFTRANLHSFALHNVETEGAILDGTIIGPAQLKQLRGAKLRGPVILRGGASNVTVSAVDVKKLLESISDREVADANPSFDCSDARSNVEEEICEDDGNELRLLDREEVELYDRLKVVDQAVRTSQLAWLKRRNKCDVSEYTEQCIRESYFTRKGELLALLGETDWLKSGEEALFVDEQLPVQKSFQDTALFKKITPALVGASPTEILVKRGKNGDYSIKGFTVGANAHLCNLEAAYLFFSKDSGWYIPVVEGPEIPIFRVFNDRLEIFANGRPDYEKYPDAGDFMSCGARASFGEMIRINVDEETLAKVRGSLSETM